MPELQSVVLGDEAVQVATSDSAAFTKGLAKIKADHKAEINGLTAKIDAKDGELAKKDAEIEDLNGKVLDAAAIDALVEDRARLRDRAKALAPNLDTKGLSDADIRRKALEAAGVALDGKSEAYIEAAFDARADMAEEDEDETKDKRKTDADPFRQATRDAKGKAQVDARDVYLQVLNGGAA